MYIPTRIFSTLPTLVDLQNLLPNLIIMATDLKLDYWLWGQMWAQNALILHHQEYLSQ